jgi:hypothetical protein
MSSSITAVDNEESIQSVDTPAAIRRAGHGIRLDWRSRMTRLPRRADYESQMNLSAASRSVALGLPVLGSFVSRVLPARMVPSDEVGTLAAVLIYHVRLKWDSIRVPAVRRVFETGLALNP